MKSLLRQFKGCNIKILNREKDKLQKKHSLVHFTLMYKLPVHFAKIKFSLQAVSIVNDCL